MTSKLLIRIAQPKDATSFVNLQKRLSHESEFLLQTELETSLMSVTQQETIFKNIELNKSLNKVLVAEYEDTLIGFLGFATNDFFRMKHVVNRLAIGVIKDFQRSGCATMLFTKAEQIWHNDSIHRVEFTTMTDNLAAINLYLKLGYTIEGVRKESILRNDKYIDEYYFAKIF